MKKTLYFGIAALAVLAFSACQKETAVNEKEMVTVTLTAQKPGEETRTAAVEEESKVSYKWTAEDKENLKLFVVGQDDEGKETLTEIENRVVAISSDNKVLTVTATVEAGSTLRTAVANAWTTSNKPKINVNQSPKTDNFDPGADILVAEDVTVDELNEALLDFSRPAAINKMTLKNLIAGEKIHEITISSDKNLAGYYENGVMKGQDGSLTLSYENVEVGEDGEFPVYFVTMPNAGQTLTVVVKSDQFVYTKTFGTVNFSVGKFSKFGVKLPDGVPVVNTDYTGDWVITGVNGNNVYAAQAFVSGNNNLRAIAVELNVDDEEIASSEVEGIKMHFEKIVEGDYADLYTIKDASGNYLYAASSSANNLMGATTLGGADYYWAVEKETDGTYSIKAAKSSNRNVMQFNSGSSLFSCYASATQKPVILYPYSWVVEGAQPSGSGTLDDPYNALAANAAVKDLTWTSNSEYQTTENVYVKGKISRIANGGTFTEGGSYGNASFYISDDGQAINEFYCFRILYLENQKFEAGQTDIKVGDEVIVYGKLMNYRGNTPETVANSAYLYSLNGVTAQEDPELVSIAITTAPTTTTFTVGDTFVFNGKVTATYDDGSTKDVTASVTTDGATVIASAGENKTVTVSYTENSITKTATYTVTVLEATGETIQFSWKRNGTNDVVTDGYVFTAVTAKSADGYYQDKNTTDGLDLTITKSTGAIFTSAPAMISLSATVGGGSAKDPLTNNVLAYLLDGDGNNIAGTETVVTTKVESKNGTTYTVNLPVVTEAYGVRIVHEKEASYNVRLFNISVTIK